MENQIATGADAQLIMKLYDLRREKVMRQARLWVVFEFNPKTVEEFAAASQDFASDHATWLRQVISYWEMAASFVLHGAVNADMYLANNGEGIFIYTKFSPFAAEIEARTGQPFMPLTAQMVEKFPGAKDRFQRITKMLAARQMQNSK